MNRFISFFAQTIPTSEFFTPENTQRITNAMSGSDTTMQKRHVLTTLRVDANHNSPSILTEMLYELTRARRKMARTCGWVSSDWRKSMASPSDSAS